MKIPTKIKTEKWAKDMNNRFFFFLPTPKNQRVNVKNFQLHKQSRKCKVNPETISHWSGKMSYQVLVRNWLNEWKSQGNASFQK